MSATGQFNYLESIETDNRSLLSVAEHADLTLPVPPCPGWTLRDLVEHVSGANRWVAQCVSSGLTPQRRILPTGPASDNELLAWSRESVDELLSVLSDTSPDELVWTPIQGPLGSSWWRRQAALEAAIHRTDAENAVDASSEALTPALALDGIDEYAEEFLPLMLRGVSEPPPVTAVLLSPDDSDESRTLSLIAAGTYSAAGPPAVELQAPASDLLLWMWNRVPDGTLKVSGDDAILTWWKSLAI